MKSSYLTVGTAFFLITLGNVASATTQCNAASVKALANSCEEKDHTGIGTDAVASCSASIRAPKGYFFFKKDLKLLFQSTYEGLPKAGATSPTGKQTLSVASYRGLPAHYSSNPLIAGAGTMLSGATANAYCRRSHGSRHRKACYARAKISVKAYPLACLAKWTGG